MLILLAPLVAAAELTVFTQTPAAVTVDGKLVEYDDASLLLVVRNLKGGKHTVKVTNLGGKAITQMDVVLQQTERTDLVYAERTLTQVGGGLVGEPAVTARYAAVPAFGGQAGSVRVAVSDGLGGTVTMSAGVPAPPVVIVTSAPPSRPAEPPKPEPVQVIFSLKDSFDMSNVYVDGKRVAEFRTGDKEKAVALMTGTHTVEIKEFTEFDTWFKGTLTVTPGEPIRFGYGEDEGVEVYNRSGSVWAPR